MNIQLRIQQEEDRLSKTDIRIADYVLAHRDEVKSLTSTEFAQRITVGQSSVIKFIKKIGFTGFTDFKIALSEELAREKNPKEQAPYGALHNNITLEDSIETIASKISYNHIRSIESTLTHILDSDMLQTVDTIIDHLDKARKIVILGIGASSLVAKDFEHKLTKIGKIAIHDLDSHVQVTHAISVNSQDVILTISHSGETELFIETLKAVEKKSITRIAITGSKVNTISKLSDLNICTVASENFIRSSALSSRITQLTIIDMLFIGLLKRNYQSGIEYIEKSHQVVRGLKI